MGAVQQAVASAVPSAVPSASNTVAVNSRAQRQPYTPMSGSSVVPFVPGGQAGDETPWQPGYGGTGSTGEPLATGSAGAPSVPADGFLFRKGPIDAHYAVPSGQNPYATVGRPGTTGWLTFIKAFANGIFQGKQDVDNAGWQVRAPQQRTSYMRFNPPPHGEFGTETYVPHQLPQQPRTQQFLPVIGSDAPGARILNTSTYGAGQVAGGIGGNQYTPAPGPPDTTQAAAAQSSGMPTWG